MVSKITLSLQNLQKSKFALFTRIIKKINITIEFSIFELVYLPDSILNRQFCIFFNICNQKRVLKILFIFDTGQYVFPGYSKIFQLP